MHIAKSVHQEAPDRNGKGMGEFGIVINASTVYSGVYGNGHMGTQRRRVEKIHKNRTFTFSFYELTLQNFMLHVLFFGHVVRYTVDVKTHLSSQKRGCSIIKEVQAMKTYNLTRHLTTILTVFAAIFLLASSSI
jgi:hypothetical protein